MNDFWQVRWPWLLRPFLKGMGWYLASYTATTALLRPWGARAAWSVVVPLLAGVALGIRLWRPWSILAPDSRGIDSRPGPFAITVLLCVATGWSLHQLLHARLGPVRDLRSVRELAQPGTAIYFRLHGPFYVDKLHRGEYTDTSKTTSKGTTTYYAYYYYACPLLAAPADTATPPTTVIAWLGHTDADELGRNISVEEQRRLSHAFFARCRAQLDTLNLGRFKYLEREELGEGLRMAIGRSRLSPGSPSESLLLMPVTESFGWRGLPWLGLVLGTLLAGGLLVVWLLLATNLLPPAEWPPHH